MLAFVAEPKTRTPKEETLYNQRSSTRPTRREREEGLTCVSLFSQLPLLIEEEMQDTHSYSHTSILPILTRDHDLRSRSKMRFDELGDFSEERSNPVLVGSLNEYEMKWRW